MKSNYLLVLLILFEQAYTYGGSFMKPTSIKYGKITVEITNPDRILFPADKITKLDLIEYYQSVAPIMIPHTKGRPISMQRFPTGIDKEGFYQKDAGEYFPLWVPIEPIKKESGKAVNYVVIDNEATLIYLANQACITPHLWLSKIDNLDYPDRMIFDLDPAHKSITFKQIVQTALQLKELLEKVGLTPFVMTTGSRGLHVTVPLDRKANFDQVRTFARDVAAYVVDQNPKLLTLETRLNKRGKRIFIDWLRNGFGATGVAPYAVRAHDGAPVATPLTWAELKDPKLNAQSYTIKNIGKRINKMGDVWKDIFKKKGSIAKASKLLDKLTD